MKTGFVISRYQNKRMHYHQKADFVVSRFQNNKSLSQENSSKIMNEYVAVLGFRTKGLNGCANIRTCRGDGSLKTHTSMKGKIINATEAQSSLC